MTKFVGLVPFFRTVHDHPYEHHNYPHSFLSGHPLHPHFDDSAVLGPLFGLFTFHDPTHHPLDEDLRSPFGWGCQPGHSYRVFHPIRYARPGEYRQESKNDRGPPPYWRPYSSLGRSRTGMSTVTNDQAEFKVNLDMQQFNPEDIRVKVIENYIVIEGSHEEKEEAGSGIIERQFTRKYLLPSGVKADEIRVEISPDGVLTIHAPKVPPVPSGVREKEIPVVKVDKPALPPKHEVKEQRRPEEVVGSFEVHLPPGTIEESLKAAEKEEVPVKPVRQPLAPRENLPESEVEGTQAPEFEQHEAIPEEKLTHVPLEQEHVPMAEHHLPRPEFHVPETETHEVQEVQLPEQQEIQRPEQMEVETMPESHVPAVEHVLPIPERIPTAEAQLPSAAAMHMPLAEHHVQMAEHHLALAERHVEKAEKQVEQMPGVTPPRMADLRHVPMEERHSPVQEQFHVPHPELRHVPMAGAPPPPPPPMPAEFQKPELRHVPESEIGQRAPVPEFHVPQPELRHVPRPDIPEPVVGFSETEAGPIEVPSEQPKPELTEKMAAMKMEEQPEMAPQGPGPELITPVGEEEAFRTKLGDQPSVQERKPEDIGSEKYQPMEKGADVLPGLGMSGQYFPEHMPGHEQHQRDVEEFQKHGGEKGLDMDIIEEMQDIEKPLTVPEIPQYTSWGTPTFQSTGAKPEVVPLGAETPLEAPPLVSAQQQKVGTAPAPRISGRLEEKPSEIPLSAGLEKQEIPQPVEERQMPLMKEEEKPIEMMDVGVQKEEEGFAGGFEPTMDQHVREMKAGEGQLPEVPMPAGMRQEQEVQPSAPQMEQLDTSRQQPVPGLEIRQHRPPASGLTVTPAQPCGAKYAPTGGISAPGTESRPSAPQPMEPTLIVKMQPSGMSAELIPPGGSLGGPHISVGGTEKGQQGAGERLEKQEVVPEPVGERGI